MFLDEYPEEKLQTVWGEFAKVKNSYTPNERWNEVIDMSYKNTSFLSLTLDDALYNFYKNTFNEDDEKTMSPFYIMSWMIILAKKIIIEYDVEQIIYYNEFETYFQTTRLSSLFERIRELSDFKEQFAKYENKLLELFPKEEITLYNVFNNEEYVKEFDKLCLSDEFGIEFIDTFGNMLAYDFVRNYFHLHNERDLSNMYNYCNKEDEDYELSTYGECCTAPIITEAKITK